MELTEAQRRLAAAGVLSGIFLAAIEGTVVATAMPTAAGSLGSMALIHYVFVSYHLSAACTIAIWGKLADVWGMRRSFLLGCILFLAGSALCGLAQNLHQLIAFRFIQGLGAGSIYPISQTALGAIYTEVKRAKMQVYLSLVWAVASIIGPPVGAFVTETFSWRWVFYLNLPAGILSLLLVHVGLRNIQEQEGKYRIKHFDWVGSLLIFCVIAAVIAAISVDRQGKFLLHPPAIAILLLIAGVLAAYFIVHIKNSEHPFISPALLRNEILMRAGVGSFFMCMAAFGTTAFLPLYCQLGLKQSISEAGRTLTIFLFGWITVSAIAARAYLKYSMRSLVCFGTGLISVVFAYLGIQTHGISLNMLRGCLFFLGVGMGMSFAPILLGVQSALPRQELGSGTASLQLLRNLGGLLGVTLLGTLLAFNFNGMLPFLGGAGINENPHVAMSRVFLMDAALCAAALSIFWNLPTVLPRYH